MKLLKKIFKNDHGVAMRLPSTFAELQHFMPLPDFQRLSLSIFDRREIFGVAATRIGLTEAQLMRRIAERLKVPFVADPQPMNLELLTGATLQELRRTGAIGINTDLDCIGFICIDPAALHYLAPSSARSNIHLSTWAEIARALEQSEKLLAVKTSARKRRERENDQAKFRKLLGILVDGVSSYGSSEIEIDCSEQQPKYRFISSKGKIGSAPLDRTLRQLLLVECNAASDSGSSNDIRLNNGEQLPVEIRRSAVKGAFSVHWKRPEIVSHENLAPSNVVALQTPDSTAAAIDAIQPRSSARVLVIDDNETFARVLERFLARLEITVELCSDGMYALEELQRNTPDLVICDMHMPGSSGVDVIKKIRASESLKSLPVIALTSDTDVNTEVRLLTTGADAFVAKSEDPRVLCAHVQRILTRIGRYKDAA